ncbi:MIP/aquaporin family protein [Aeribacillus alveayuensis]|uniref:Glycerol uptake facilitator protein n=1 Tax=Aeribacillus alveayuensis TaxID=279215 RepID=A0ABT9VQG4_9BACI|nr:glycerol uptake facilitator protein [Bacillus alveayuensis]
MTAFMGELIGTMILIVLGAGVCAGVNLKKSFAQNSGWIVITFGWGLAVAMAVYAVGGISGAHLNPAVTISLAIVGDFPWSLVPSYIVAQMIGAFLGAVLIYFHYLPHWKETEEPSVKLGVFSTGPAIQNTFANFFSELFGTFILVLGILAIGANKFTEGLNPLIVGFLIVSIGLSLGGTTGYAINPARDLGPRIAHFILPIPEKGSSNWKYAWIPVIGPLAGGTFGGLFYQYIFEGKEGHQFWIGSFVLAVILLVIYFINKKEASISHTKKAVY